MYIYSQIVYASTMGLFWSSSGLPLLPVCSTYMRKINGVFRVRCVLIEDTGYQQ